MPKRYSHSRRVLYDDRPIPSDISAAEIERRYHAARLALRRGTATTESRQTVRPRSHQGMASK